MPRASNTIAPVVANGTRYAAAATGATWTLGQTTTTDGVAHTVTILNKTTTNHSSKTALITGTDANGIAQTETVALPDNSGTTTSTKYFKTVSSIVPSATIGADTMDLGFGTVCVTPWVVLDYKRNIFNVAHWLLITGTANVTVECAPEETYPPVNICSDATLAAKTSTAYAALTVRTKYVRAKINSFSASASLTYVVEEGES